MEKQFLQYLLYIALIDIRERSYENGDKKSFYLADILHNVPLQLNHDKDIKEAYKNLLDNIEVLGLREWFNKRYEEFLESYPEYKK
ncbi:MAG: hypothetical protein IT249_19390 [Chitinophagaceae bacterium]|nr:hypothetical protein [Chitinophagaceae bacterium]